MSTLLILPQLRQPRLFLIAEVFDAGRRAPRARQQHPAAEDGDQDRRQPEGGVVRRERRLEQDEFTVALQQKGPQLGVAAALGDLGADGPPKVAGEVVSLVASKKYDNIIADPNFRW